MSDNRPSTVVGDCNWEFLDAPLDPGEISVALSGLQEMMERIWSPAIRSDLRDAYDRIARLAVVECD